MPRSRLGASRSNSNNSSVLANNPTNTFGSNQQQPFPAMNGGGNTFGASQSFPPATGGTNSGFNFQTPQSNSFNFGAPSSIHNPFTAMNGIANPGTNQQQDVAMESPQKKRAPPGGFRADTARSNTGAGFNFSQPAQQQSGGTFGFGANHNTNTNGGGLFGRISQPEGPAAPNNPFGSPSQSQSAFGGFGQAVSAQQGQKSPLGFGQNAPALTAVTPPSSLFGGQSNPTPQNPTSSFGFGQGAGNIANNQPASTPFGAQTNSPSFSFGQGQPPAPSGNQFTGFGMSQTNESNGAAPFFTPLPAPQAPAITPEDEVIESPPLENANAPNPFESLLAGTSGESQAVPGFKPSFNFGTPGQTSAPAATMNAHQNTAVPKPAFSFGKTSHAPASDTPQNEAAPKPAFNFAATSQPAPQAAGTPFFGFKPAQAENSANVQDTPAPLPPAEQKVPEPAQNEANPSAPKPPFSFLGQSQPLSSGGLFSPAKSTTKSSETTGGLFGKPAGTPTGPNHGFQFKPVSTNNQEQHSSSDLFSSTSSRMTSEETSSHQPTSKTHIGESAPPRSEVAQATQKAAPVPAFDPAKRQVYTKAPPLIPGHLGAGQFRDYDRNYRLHSLNLGLQQRIASLEPRSNDFDNVIRHYVAARDSIGASLGLYLRNVAGTKRKGDYVDDRDEELAQNKRSRSTNDRQSPPSQPKQDFASSGTGSQNSSTTIVKDATPLKATNLLSNMIPESRLGTEVSQSTLDLDSGINLFGGVAAVNSFTQLKQDQHPVSKVSESFSVGPAPSTTPGKSPLKKATFEVPKFGAGTTNFMNSFGQQAKENAARFEKSLMEKRKAEDFDSDEDDEDTFLKQTEKEMRAKREKIDAIAKGGFIPTGFAPARQPPSVSTSSKPSFNFSTFSEAPKQDNKSTGHVFGSAGNMDPAAVAAADGEQIQDEEDKSDEDSNASSGDGVSEEDPEDGDYHDEEDDDLPEDEVVAENEEEEHDSDSDDSDDNDLIDAMNRSKARAIAGKSLFDRIEPNPTMKENTRPSDEDKKASDNNSSPIMQPAMNSTFPPALWGSHFGKATPETPSFSPITPAAGASKSSYKPAATFNFTAATPATSSAPTPGASIFAGGLTKVGPVPGEGLFGSRPSTPSNAEKTTKSLTKSLFTSPAGTDNTWKQGAPISFGNGEKTPSAPQFKFTAPSPGGNESTSTAKPFGSLFGKVLSGTTTPESPTSEGAQQLGFNFGAPAPAPAPGFLGAISHLGGGSAASSAVSSRATSPGLTDNESVATNDTEETHDDPQTSLMDSRPGEENETCLWEGRSKALMFVSNEAARGTKWTPNAWNSMGIGLVRVLQDRATDKTRVVFRVEPSASILINSHLVESVTYENVPPSAPSSKPSGAVRGALFYKGSLTRWVFKVKTPEMAAQLATVLEENKTA